MRPISEIAQHVRDRRTQLRLSQRRAAILANVSSTTWQAFEKHHHPVSELTLAGMAVALKWPSDWFERLQAGEDPETLEPQASSAGRSDVADLAPLSEEDKAAVWAIIESLKAKGRP